jgi:hypothetical protein
MPESSSKKVITVVVILLIVIAAGVVISRRRPTLPQDKITRVAMASMSSDLQGLIIAEETTKRLTGRYLSDPARAGAISSPGVTVPVVVLSDSGWAATVGFKTIPEIHCAVGVYTRNPLKRFAKNGEIVCE